MMSNLNEKKWFVYMGDHHEGPFSLGEIAGKMTEGQMTSQHYVWADGMADWKVMPEVSDFASILSPGAQDVGPSATGGLQELGAGAGDPGVAAAARQGGEEGPEPFQVHTTQGQHGHDMPEVAEPRPRDDFSQASAEITDSGITNTGSRDRAPVSDTLSRIQAQPSTSVEELGDLDGLPMTAEPTEAVLEEASTSHSQIHGASTDSASLTAGITTLGAVGNPQHSAPAHAGADYGAPLGTGRLGALKPASPTSNVSAGASPGMGTSAIEGAGVGVGVGQGASETAGHGAGGAAAGGTYGEIVHEDFTRTGAGEATGSLAGLEKPAGFQPAPGESEIQSMQDGTLASGDQTMGGAPHPVGEGRMLDAPGNTEVNQIQLDDQYLSATAGPIRPSFAAIMTRWVLRLAIIGGIGFGFYFANERGYIDQVTQTPPIKKALSAIDGAVRPHLITLVQKIPALGKWVSVFPAVSDVSEEDYEDLKAAADFDLEKAGPKIALGLINKDFLSPSFYVGSNLPDGTNFEIYIKGVPGTLLNRLDFETKAAVTTMNGLGKSQAIRFPDGKPIPRGQYMVYAYEKVEQSARTGSLLKAMKPSALQLPQGMPSGKKLVEVKTYFLGGKKDAIYTARLRAYHDKLKGKIGAELDEVGQFSATLDSQFNISMTKFRRYSVGKITRTKRNAWNRFHRGWIRLNQHLNTQFEKWTPERIRKTKFHSDLYAATRKAGESILEAHDLQHQYFNRRKANRRKLRSQVLRANGNVRMAVQELKKGLREARAKARKWPPAS